jgi:hypothetical protein
MEKGKEKMGGERKRERERKERRKERRKQKTNNFRTLYMNISFLEL